MAAKKKGSDETAVAIKTVGGEVATADDYAAFSGGGFENQDNSDILVPFLKVLQSNNPEVKPEKNGGIAGAEEGMLLNSVTNQLFDSDKGVLFVPGTTKHVFVEWVPIEQGGGFVGEYGENDKIVVDALEASTDFGKYKTSEGNDLVETFYVYGVLCPEGEEPQPVTIAFTSTKIKVYKKWNSALRMFLIPTADDRKINPPMFSHLVRITSVAQKKDNFDFHNFVMAPANGEVKSSLLKPDDDRFQAAMALGKLVDDGVVRPNMETETGEGNGSGPAPVAGEGNTPF